MSETPHREADSSSRGVAIAPSPQVDFASFGPIETRPLSRIQSLVASHLTRNWVTIPHVTHHDDADIEALEALRRQRAAQCTKLTALAFLVKAAVAALRAFPVFNASLDATGKNLILKHYCHIGFAVDTPNGLLVPVIRDADRKNIEQIAAEITALSQQARTKGLPLDRMTGGCFTLSSLGGIGGTGFTPIINAPEVAVMGVTQAYRKPHERPEGKIEWRTALPLSLSYDHRVINGADAARFCLAFAKALSTPDKL